ncbi:LOB domain-containing protein 36-like [Euphorbia lathyris]|uniref:LOB domain-containing protein 36-like n=1 Tax=Euphorbia lathyris TaxID=212925 RepID=UPI0033133E30
MSAPNSPCAACKFLRRKCTQECVFAPYFPPDQPQKFANVHRVFGASNVSKLLNELNTTQREDAVNSLAYEAEARLRDPVYGCVGLISILQHRLKEIQTDLFSAKEQLAQYIGPQALLPPQLQTPAYLTQQQHLMANNPSSSMMVHNNALPLMGNSSTHELGSSSGSGSGGQQFLLGDSDQQRRFQAQQQQQQVFHAQRMAAEQQEMMARAYEQKQDQIFNRDFQVTVASNMSPSLGLGNFDSSNYNIQAQQIDHNQHQHRHQHQHHQINPAGHPHQEQQQLQAELFLHPHQQQRPHQTLIQPLQISQPRPSGSDDAGPVGSSC